MQYHDITTAVPPRWRQTIRRSHFLLENVLTFAEPLMLSHFTITSQTKHNRPCNQRNGKRMCIKTGKKIHCNQAKRDKNQWSFTCSKHEEQDKTLVKQDRYDKGNFILQLTISMNKSMKQFQHFYTVCVPVLPQTVVIKHQLKNMTGKLMNIIQVTRADFTPGNPSLHSICNQQEQRAPRQAVCSNLNPT